MTLLATTSAFAVSLAVLVGLIYLAILRLVDINEREPAWALGLSLMVGAIAGLLLPVFVKSSVLVLEPFWGALAEGVALFLALAIVLAAFEGIGRVRGWSEISGLMDAIVHGAAVGLGLAAGAALVSNLRFESGAFDELLGISRFDVLWTAVLAGLATGLVGAIVGAGLGWALESQSAVKYVAFPIGGLVLAVIFGWLYRLLFEGGSDGTGGLVRLWLGLLLPVVGVAITMIVALARERHAIASELADEMTSGLVTEEDARFLEHPVARRLDYASAFISGDLDRWAMIRALHNRQVHLALVKHRTAHMSGARRSAGELEAAHLRAAIAALQASLGEASPGGRPEGAAS